MVTSSSPFRTTGGFIQTLTSALNGIIQGARKAWKSMVTNVTNIYIYIYSLGFHVLYFVG